jgi:hypothetical protein
MGARVYPTARRPSSREGCGGTGLEPLIKYDNILGCLSGNGAGYVIRLYMNDHPPLHVHVFKDEKLVARYDVENHVFLLGSEARHFGRIKKALRDAGII